MNFLRSFKPQFLFAPKTLARRIRWSPPLTDSLRTTLLVWGDHLLVDPVEDLGRSLDQQGIFDLAVSEVAWRLVQPGDRVIDGGANIGYMTRLFQRRVGPLGSVDAFEPHPEIARLLRSNVELRSQGLGPVVVHEAALGSHSGQAALHEPEGFAKNRGMATLEPGRETGRSHQVALTTLDEAFPAGDFALLKLDLEEHEMAAITGGARLLGSGRVQNVLFEDQLRGASGVAVRLAEYGYSVFALATSFWGPRLLPVSNRLRGTDWGSPNYLATLDAVSTGRRLGHWGWDILR